MTRLLDILSVLGQIFVVCLPVFFAIEFLDRATSKLSERFANYDWAEYFDRRLTKLKAKEQVVWDKRAHDINERDKHD